MGDDGFIRAIRDDPDDDSLRLIYADWLEEQGDPVSAAKAEFLRVTVQQSTATVRKKERKAQADRLQQLAAQLDTGWLAVVSRLPIENCQGKRAAAEAPLRPRESLRMIPLKFICDRRWEDLRPTDDKAVRFCDACRQNVHYCDTIIEARRHAWVRHCIAIDLGVIRRDEDLVPERIYAGWPSEETLRKEQERMQPDPVSAERERRKRDHNTDEAT